MQFILPIILVVISGLLFFTWVDPQYKEIKELQTQYSQYQETLEKTEEIRSFRRDIQSKINSISTEDLIRIEKLLPSRIDNIKLILDINTIADRNGLTIRGIRIDRSSEKTGTDGRTSIETNEDSVFGTIGFSFSVVSTYENFKRFAENLSQSLRVVDITSISISEIPQEEQFYRFDVGIKTYWLK